MEPIGGVQVLLLASVVTPLMPFLLAFAAEGNHSNLGTIGFALGFALMMVLDVVMG